MASVTNSRHIVLRSHTHVVKSIAVLPDGCFASGSYDNTVRVWRQSEPASMLSPWECAAVLKGHTSGVVAIAVLPDGCLASGSWDKTVRVWRRSDPASPSSGWECAAVLEGHTNHVRAVAVLPDGCLVSSGLDGVLRVWLQTANLEWESRKHVIAALVVTSARGCGSAIHAE